MGQMKGYMYGPEKHQQTPKAQSSRCMGCPTYGTEGKAHDVRKCPLRNGDDDDNNNTTNNQGQKRSSNGVGSLAQRARTYI